MMLKTGAACGKSRQSPILPEFPRLGQAVETPWYVVQVGISGSRKSSFKGDCGLRRDRRCGKV